MSATPSAPHANATPPAVEKLSFEAAMQELEAVVRRLESGNVDLESSIADYLRGAALKQHCEKKLNEARLRVEAIVKSADGSPPTAQPFPLPAGDA